MTENAELLQQALFQHRAGRSDLAEPLYRRIIADDPTCHEAWHLLGVVELQRGKFEEAIKFLKEACRLEGNNSRYFNNLGNALGQAGLISEADQAYRKSHGIDPTFLDPLYNLGVILERNQRLDDAEALYRRVLEIDPKHPAANNNLGVLAKGRGQALEAEDYFEKAVAADPDYFDARANLGIAAEERGDARTAIDAFNLVLSRAPSETIRLKRDLLMPAMYESVEEIDQARKKFESNLDILLDDPPSLADPVRECSRGTFFLTYHGYDDRALQEKVSTLYRKACPSLNYTAPHCGKSRQPGSRIKIGFVSNYLRNHTIGKLNRGLIAHLPRDEFEITLFPVITAKDDPIANFVRDHADHVTPLAQRLIDSMKRIADHEIDILYYTDIGMDPYTYFLAFGRLAPVQCVTWGHPVTTGIDTVDYFISAEPGEIAGAQDHYSEKLIKLAHFTTYYYRPDPAPPGERAEFGFDRSAHLYLCAQSLFKLHPEMDTVFADILERDSVARIILIRGTNDGWIETLRMRFRKAVGANSERIVFVPRLSQEKFMRLLGLADVLLDTFPFCGGNTSLEGFALGIPIVTLPGDFLRGRLTLALYRQMGIDDGIAADKEDYVTKAVRLATEPDYRAEISTAILSRNGSLFENRMVIDEFAAFFRTALAERRQ